jgi:hypothetical protein
MFNLKYVIEQDFGETSTWLEYCFDEAILFFGTAFENKLEERNEKHEPIYTFQQVMDMCKGERKKNKITLGEHMRMMFGSVAGAKTDRT